MVKLKPWYKVVTPREDLREGKPLDASEFAVHLDQVRDGRAIEDYQNPRKFFERTFLTKNLRQMAGEVVRRLSGEKTETSAVFNMATQFGGGKTHSLTLLFHLMSHGPKAKDWPGVDTIIKSSGVNDVPEASTAVRRIPGKARHILISTSPGPQPRSRTLPLMSGNSCLNRSANHWLDSEKSASA